MDSTVIMHYMYIFERVPVFCIFFPFQFYLDVIGSAVKNPPPNVGEAGSIPGWGRPPGEGNGNPPQYSCLETRLLSKDCFVIFVALRICPIKGTQSKYSFQN